MVYHCTLLLYKYKSSKTSPGDQNPFFYSLLIHNWCIIYAVPFIKGEDLLWNDYEVKLLDQAVRSMEFYVSQFPEVRVRQEEASMQANKSEYTGRQKAWEQTHKKQQRHTRSSLTHMHTHIIYLTHLLFFFQSVGESSKERKKTGWLRLFPSPPGGTADC